MFGALGLKKTSITDLTKAAGIAQGSFYIFYESKEELYFDILELEEKEIQDKLLTESLHSENLTAQVFKQFLMKAIYEIDNNPFIRRLYVEQEFEALIRKLPKERLEKHIQNDSDMFSPLILHWQSDGVVIQKEPEVITGVVRSFILTSLHKKEIGEQIYNDTLELLAEFIAEGLVRKGGGSRIDRR